MPSKKNPAASEIKARVEELQAECEKLVGHDPNSDNMVEILEEHERRKVEDKNPSRLKQYYLNTLCQCTFCGKVIPAHTRESSGDEWQPGKYE